VIEVVRPSTIAGPRILGLFIALINCLVVASISSSLLFEFLIQCVIIVNGKRERIGDWCFTHGDKI